jgi:hypothetical protein
VSAPAHAPGCRHAQENLFGYIRLFDRQQAIEKSAADPSYDTNQKIQHANEDEKRDKQRKN